MTAASFSTYDQVGIMEDVSPIISNISPTTVPFQSGIRVGKKPKNRVVEWQEDALRDAAENAAIEGADAKTANQTPTSMRTNYIQTLTDTVKVTGMAEEVETHGRKSELAYQMAKTGKALKRDLELTLVGLDTAKVLGNDTTTASKMDSAFPQIHADVTQAAAGANLSETMVRDMLEDLYNEGADVSVLMIKPTDAKYTDGFASSVQGSDALGRRDIGTGTKVVNSVKVYVTSWGEVRIVLNRFIKNDVALGFDPEMWEIRWLRPWSKKALAITGDAESHQLIGRCTLCHKNQKASGLIEGLSTGA